MYRNGFLVNQLDDVVVVVVVAGAIAYLKGAFPMFGKGTEERSTPEWVQGLEMPSVPIILSMLRGLARGHFATQQSLDKDGVLPLLHALERVPGDNEIGARAENLLDTLSDKESKGEGFLQSKVSTLRHATRDETRRRLNKQREEVLSVQSHDDLHLIRRLLSRLKFQFCSNARAIFLCAL